MNLIARGFYIIVLLLCLHHTGSANPSGIQNTPAIKNSILLFNITGQITQPQDGQNNGAINITVSSPGSYSYNWSNGANTEDLSSLAPGTYSVTVSAGGNCIQTESFIVTTGSCSMSVAISVDVPNPGIVCVGDSITISAIVTGGTAPFTYSWSNGITTSSFTVLAPYSQTLVLGITDAEGCTALAIQHIKVNVWDFYIGYSGIPACQGDTVALIIATTSYLPGTNYLWSTGETTEVIM